MPDVVKHAWTHRPRSRGGTDPIETFVPTWATVQQSLESLSKTGDNYRPRFRRLLTNDELTFGHSAVSSLRFDYMVISQPGYYIAHFGVVTGSATIWGANNTELMLVYEDGGDIQFNTGPGLADFLNSDYSRTHMQHEDDSFLSPSAYRGLWQTYTFHYDPDNPGSDYDFTSPLQLGLKVVTAQTGSVSLTAQLFVLRIAEPGFTEFDAAD